ncbi:MAG: fluoride efflux transporter CrcB [Rubrivivax sp.]|jgi:CrcB protein|nr:fluoride efflux transporter CrcB [Rubrivivax sp.]
MPTSLALSAAAVASGAALGALARWALGLGLNHLWPQMPLGTLAANLIGGYAVGVALGVFAQQAALAPEWRLFVITGVLGGLTTFSTFSGEVVTSLQAGHPGWALAIAASHLVGSLLLTAAGLATVGAWRG